MICILRKNALLCISIHLDNFLSWSFQCLLSFYLRILSKVRNIHLRNKFNFSGYKSWGHLISREGGVQTQSPSNMFKVEIKITLAKTATSSQTNCLVLSTYMWRWIICIFYPKIFWPIFQQHRLDINVHVYIYISIAVRAIHADWEKNIKKLNTYVSLKISNLEFINIIRICTFFSSDDVKIHEIYSRHGFYPNLNSIWLKLCMGYKIRIFMSIFFYQQIMSSDWTNFSKSCSL